MNKLNNKRSWSYKISDVAKRRQTAILGLSRNDEFPKSELLPNAQDVQFLAQRSIADLCKLGENYADWITSVR